MSVSVKGAMTDMMTISNPETAPLGRIGELTTDLINLFVSAPAPTASTTASPAEKENAARTAALSPALSRARQTPSLSAPPLTTPTGCAMHDSVNTAFVVSDLHGQTARLDLVLSRIKELALRAKRYGNQIHIAFLGNNMPSRHAGAKDMGVTLLEYSRKGIPDLEIETGGVHVIAGSHELRYLRLVDRGEAGEMTTDRAKIPAVLLNGPPLAGVSECSTYEQALLDAFGEGALKQYFQYAAKHNSVQPEEDLLCVAMWLKLEALVAMGLHFEYQSPDAPGLVRVLLAQFASKTSTDNETRAMINTYIADDAMRCQANDRSWLVRQLTRHLSGGPDGIYLNAKGSAIAPFCQVALDVITSYVRDIALPLLAESKLVDLVLPPKGDSIEYGLWLMNFRTVDGSCMQRLPVDATVVNGVPVVSWQSDTTTTAPIEWMNSFNAYLSRAVDGSASPAELRTLNALSFDPKRSDPSHNTGCPPLTKMVTRRSLRPVIGVVGGLMSRPFGTCQRTLDIEVGKGRATTKRTTSWWVNVDTSAYTPCTAWTALSWCHNTQTLLTPPELHVDRSVTLSDWQFDVGCTLSALVQFAETDLSANKLLPSKPWEKTFGTMSGMVGPLVKAGREDEELLRAVWWSTRVNDSKRHNTNKQDTDTSDGEDNAPPPDVLTFLPEAYLRQVLVDYYVDTLPNSPGWRCAGAITGFLTLPDDTIVPMRVPGLSASEELDAAKAMGPRIWRLPWRGLRDATQDVNRGVGVLKHMMGAPSEWTRGASEKNAFLPGMRIKSPAGERVFYTCTSTLDPLNGLALCWRFAPGGGGALPTLDIDNGRDGQQAPLETVRKAPDE